MEILRGQKLQLAALVPHPENYNRHGAAQVADLATSLMRFGQVAAVIVQAGPQAAYGVGPEQYLLLKGHGLTRAAREQLRWAEIVADVLPAAYPPELAVAYLAADNELARAADPDQEQLGALLTRLQTTDQELARLAAGGAGRLTELLDALGAGAQPEHSGTQDTAGACLAQWPVQPGQVWVIPSKVQPGAVHRLLVGDSSNPEQVARLFGDQVATCLLTDPPYGVDYGEKETELRRGKRNRRSSRTHSTVAADALSDYTALYRDFLAAAPLAAYNAVYVFMSAVQTHTMRLAFDAAGVYFSQYLTWVKNRRVLGRTDFQYQTEAILVGGTGYVARDVAAYLSGAQGAACLAELTAAGFPDIEVGAAVGILYGWRGKHKFYGKPGKNSNVIFADNPTASPYHPTTKPWGLLGQLLGLSTRRGEIVYDPFAGSGSLLLAAERLGRVAYLMELEPLYAATILAQAATELGLAPQLEE